MMASYALRDQQLMAEARNYFSWQSRLVLERVGRRVVEIGCGIGNFTRLLLDDCAVLAFDIEPDCIQQFKVSYAHHANVYAHCRDWNAGDWDNSTRPLVNAFRPDSCICLNVLEHMEDDQEALRRMATILPPGGVIVLLLPAFPALYGPIDKHLGHYRRYTRKSVEQLARAVGLRAESLRYMNSLGLFAWWVNAHISKREAQSAGQIRVFDRFLVPPMSRLERLLPPPFGQSILVVLRK